MNKIVFQRTAFLLTLAAIAGVSSGLSAQATETHPSFKGKLTQPIAESTISPRNLQASVADQHTLSDLNPDLILEPAPAENKVATPSIDSTASELSAPLPELQPLNIQTAEIPAQTELMLSQEPSTSNESVQKQPVPGTAQTSAAELSVQSASNKSVANTTSDASLVAQEDLAVNPATPGANYLGVGGGLGLTGETALGDLGFAIISKLRLTRLFSFRPAVVISGDVDFLLPITYDFPVERGPFERINFAPYLGAGATVTSSGSHFGGLLTGGVDIPISRQFTANASLNLDFTGSSVGLGFIFGLGYNFSPGFFNF